MEVKDDNLNRRAAWKLRKLMMGESASESELMYLKGAAVANDRNKCGSGVGSYLVSCGNKRTASIRDQDEKQSKEEVVTANVFSTGKITFTGAKSINSLNCALEKLKPAIGLRSEFVGGYHCFAHKGTL